MLIFKKGIKPSNIDGVKKTNEYTHKLGGWINRLNSIRARLKCSKCCTPFKPNLKYAKNLAKFNTTVLTCIHEEEGHDKNIYFNQCWRCKEVIDSRESSIKIEDMYLCTYCGAGPMNSIIYEIGTICHNVVVKIWLTINIIKIY